MAARHRGSFSMKVTMVGVLLLYLALATAHGEDEWFTFAARGSASEVEAALVAGADVNARDPNGWPAIAIAAARNPIPDVIYILARSGADLEAEVEIDMVTWKPVHLAAASNPSSKVLYALLDSGADIMSRTSSGTTALHIAAGWKPNTLSNEPRFDEFLVRADHVDGEVLTLSEPFLSGTQPTSVILFLPSLGFSFEARLIQVDADGMTLTLERAPPVEPDLEQVTVMVPLPLPPEPPRVEATRDEVVNVLLQAGADVNARDNYGYTPLFTAAREADGADVMRLLLNAGADPDARSMGGGTPLHVAAYNKESDARVVDLLVEAGIDVDAEDRFGETPLMGAVMHGSPEMIEALLSAGASPRFPEGYVSLFGADMMELARRNESLFKDGKAIHPVFWRLNDLQFD